MGSIDLTHLTFIGVDKKPNDIIDTPIDANPMYKLYGMLLLFFVCFGVICRREFFFSYQFFLRKIFFYAQKKFFIRESIYLN